MNMDVYSEVRSRIKKMKCPVCKSENVKQKETIVRLAIEFNDTITRIEDYFVCQECGIMFEEVKK